LNELVVGRPLHERADVIHTETLRPEISDYVVRQRRAVIEPPETDFDQQNLAQLQTPRRAFEHLELVTLYVGFEQYRLQGVRR